MTSTPNHDTELEEILQTYELSSMKVPAREQLLKAINTYLYKQTLELIKENVAYPELKNMIDADKLKQAAAERWGQ